MARNPFTSESRDIVMSLNNGVIAKLRTSETLRSAIVARKPEHLGLGDFANKAMYDEPLIALILAGDYRAVQAALEADWGPLVPVRSTPATDVVNGHKRS